MKEDIPFCRFCQHQLPYSSKPVMCKACKRSSVPLTERGISITPKEVKAKMSKKEDFLFLDVRWPTERETASIKGTTFIPLANHESNLSKLPKDKEIIAYCHLGGRSRYAAIMLLCNGFRARNMVGGIDLWSRDVDTAVPRY